MRLQGPCSRLLWNQRVNLTLSIHYRVSKVEGGRESALNLGNEGFFEYGTEGVLERMVLATADERRLVIRCEGREQVTHAPLDTLCFSRAMQLHRIVEGVSMSRTFAVFVGKKALI